MSTFAIRLATTIAIALTGLMFAPSANCQPSRASVSKDTISHKTCSDSLRCSGDSLCLAALRDSCFCPSVCDTVEKPRYFSVRTNLLHDVVAVPNIGVEIWLGGRFTLYIDYSGAWWGNRMSSTYNAGRHVWRYEGGNVEIRHYFGKASRQKPLTGWHAGVYGQAASYDFQWGDSGKQGRKASYGAGVSAGYQLPIGKRWNLDFSFALGYFGGEYKTCHFLDGHNVWVSTRHRHYVGPTRIEVSLVWLLGRGNENKEKARKKGGRHE